MKGLFNKIRNAPTRKRYVVSTIRKAENCFETAVFEANWLYLPRHWSCPDLTVTTTSKDEAWDMHFRLSARLLKEYPARLFQEYRQ